MINEAIDSTMCAGDDLSGGLFELSDLELGLILGGNEPGYAQTDPNANALDLRSSPPPTQYNSNDMRADIGLIADTTGLGAAAGTAIPAVGTTAGAAGGLAFGAGMVLEERFHVVDYVVSRAQEAAEWVGDFFEGERMGETTVEHFRGVTTVEHIR